MSQSNVLCYLVVSVLMTEYITGFIKNATIIGRPRDYIKEKSNFFNELLSCGYCLSVWVSMFMVVASLFFGYLPYIGDNIRVNTFIFLVLLPALSNAWHGFRDRYLETYKDNRYNTYYQE